MSRLSKQKGGCAPKEGLSALLAIGGGVIPEGAFEEIADAVAVILWSGHESHADQETIRAALTLVKDIARVENVSVTNSTFTNNPPSEAAAVKCGCG